MQYRLLALDVDGTLLDPQGQMRPLVQQAVQAIQQRGVRVVLCTGRRFRTALPLAQALGITGSIVVHNGAIVKDVTSGHTVQQCYFPLDVYQKALATMRQLATPMVYIDAFHENVDIVTETMERAHPFQREYLQDNLAHCRIVEDMDKAPVHAVVMMSIMADRESLQALRVEVTQRLGTQGRTHLLMNKNYQGSILEILHPTVSKWRALEHLAQSAGFQVEEIMAIGDDLNDLEMIRQAGLGVAMGNAVEAVQAAADYVTGSNAEDGLVQALEHFGLLS